MNNDYRIACEIQKTYRDRLDLANKLSLWGTLATFALSFGAASLILGPGLGLVFIVVGGLVYYKNRHSPSKPTKHLTDCEPVSPLVLDLDGDGVEASGIAHFDHGGDGWSELTRWAGADDGVLVWDSNADGVINDGSELFGNNSVLGNGRKAAHGFAALANFDSNGDGKIDSRDTGRDTNNDGVVDGKDKNWENLRVMRWTDANNNGIKDGGEESMVTLASLNIRSLGTGFNTSAHVDTHGNEHRQVGSFTKTDGTTATMTDVWFVTDQSVTTYNRSGIPTHSAAIAALPEISGGGRVYNLRDAMALDDATDANGNSRLTAPYYGNTRTETRSLRELVAAFSSSAMATNKAGREALRFCSWARTRFMSSCFWRTLKPAFWRRCCYANSA